MQKYRHRKYIHKKSKTNEPAFKTYTEISNPITEIVLKNSALSHPPYDILEIIEGDEYDAITYTYRKVYLCN